MRQWIQVIAMYTHVKLDVMQYFGKTKKLICQPFHVVVVPKFKAFEVNACNFPLLLIFEFRFRL